MALSKCKECGKDVSDKAVLCPHCGAPLPSLSEGQVENLKKQFMFSQTRWLAGTSFFFGLAWLFFAAQTGGADSFSQAWGGAKWPILAGAIWYVIAEIDRNLHERKIKKTADKQGSNR